MNKNGQGATAVSLQKIRDIIRRLPKQDSVLVKQIEKAITDPEKKLGRLKDLATWLAVWQGNIRPDMNRTRIVVFAATHKFNSNTVLETANVVKDITSGGSTLSKLSEISNSDLRLYELDTENPCADMTKGAAMTDEECTSSITYGMMAVEPGLKTVGLSDLSIGNELSAAAICYALFGGKPENWCSSDKEAKTIEAAVKKNNCDTKSDPLEVLCKLGGYEIAAVVGAIMAARMEKVPVVLDGFGSVAAAAVLSKIDAKLIDHCVVAQGSGDKAYSALLKKIAKDPVINIDFSMGHGAGAALAICALRVAAACFDLRRG